MNREQRGKYAELADTIKGVAAQRPRSENLEARSTIEACDVFLHALEADSLAPETAEGFKEAVDQLMASGSAISQHEDVFTALCEAAAVTELTDMDRMRALLDVLTARLETIHAFVEEHGYFPDLCLVGAGFEAVRVEMPDGEKVTLRANVVRPEYTEDGFLKSCPYRAILTVLDERHQYLTQSIDHGSLVWDTPRDEWYGLDGLEDFESQEDVEAALDAAAVLLDANFTQDHLLFRRAMLDTEIAADVEVIVSDGSGPERSSTTYSIRTLDLLRLVMVDDGLQFNFRGRPPAAILVFESDADAAIFVGWGGAAACNVFVVACHGRSKLTERYFIRRLSECREMWGKPVLGISDLDGGGLGFIADFWTSRRDRVPRLLRIGLTSQQLEALCDSSLRRPLPTVDNVRRFVDSADAQMREDANYMIDHGHGAHVAFLKYPPANADRPFGNRGACKVMVDMVNEHV